MFLQNRDGVTEMRTGNGQFRIELTYPIYHGLIDAEAIVAPVVAFTTVNRNDWPTAKFFVASKPMKTVPHGIDTKVAVIPNAGGIGVKTGPLGPKVTPSTSTLNGVVDGSPVRCKVTGLPPPTAVPIVVVKTTAGGGPCA